MEYNTPLKISALAFIERVKANPEEFHEYVISKYSCKELTDDERREQRRKIIARLKAEKNNAALSV